MRNRAAGCSNSVFRPCSRLVDLVQTFEVLSAGGPANRAAAARLLRLCRTCCTTNSKDSTRQTVPSSKCNVARCTFYSYDFMSMARKDLIWISTVALRRHLSTQAKGDAMWKHLLDHDVLATRRLKDLKNAADAFRVTKPTFEQLIRHTDMPAHLLSPYTREEITGFDDTFRQTKSEQQLEATQSELPHLLSPKEIIQKCGIEWDRYYKRYATCWKFEPSKTAQHRWDAVWKGNRIIIARRPMQRCKFGINAIDDAMYTVTKTNVTVLKQIVTRTNDNGTFQVRTPHKRSGPAFSFAIDFEPALQVGETVEIE